MRSRTFLHVSLGILALALAYHFGARSATAQSGAQVTGFSVAGGTDHFVMTPNGDVFLHTMSNGSGGPYNPDLAYIGNFWSGAPTRTSQESFGSVKARYRGDREPQGVKPSTNR